MSAETLLDSRVLQAVVAGLFVAIGWAVNGWQNRREDRRRRAERLRDVHRALFAEIGVYLSGLGSPEQIDGERRYMISRMRDDDTFVPFLPREGGDHVYRTVLPDIHILPRSSIDVVVAFYTQVANIDALVDDIRSPSFRRLSQPRRMAVYGDLMGARGTAFLTGQAARHLIDLYAREGAVAARQELNRLRGEAVSNRPAEAPYASPEAAGSE